MAPAEILGLLDPSESPGDLGKLGPYRVSEVLGQGGMGIVLKAFDPALHRAVAIKVLAPAARDQQLGPAAVRPRGPGRGGHSQRARGGDPRGGRVEGAAVPGHGVHPGHARSRTGSTAPRRWTSPRSCGSACRRPPGWPRRTAQGLVHRDIKPSNILLENGVERVKLTDFGLARAVDDASLTQSGVVAGTPLFMAPEQARCETIDHRADLFSLGAVLYAMCTGRSPFRASTTLGVLRRVSDDPHRPVREVNPEIPHWLAAIIDRLLAKDRAQRYQSAAEVSELLGRHLARRQRGQVDDREPERVDRAADRVRDRGRRAGQGTSGCSPPLDRPSPAPPCPRRSPRGREAD